MDANAADPNGIYPFFTCAKELSRIDNWAFDCECVLVAGNCNPHVSYYKGKFNAYQRVYVIQSRDKGSLNIKYLYYFLKKYMTLVLDRQRGAIEKFFCLDDFTDIKIALPDLPTQLRIAGVLGSIDEKIELNRKKIAELEALAKTIYDYWFVQLDFPDKNGKPYKSSGGKMVWNDQLKREVPEGWKAWCISKCGRFHRGVSYSKQDEVGKDSGGISVYRGNNIAKGFVVRDSNEVFIPKNMVAKSQILQRGQVLIAMSSGSKDHVGKAGLVTRTYPECAFGAFCTAFEPFDEYQCLVYDFFRSATYRSYIKQICSGTGINNLKTEHLETDILAVPDWSDILGHFNSVQKPLYEQIMSLDEECAAMQDMRDKLLPFLMNGQVFVG